MLVTVAQWLVLATIAGAIVGTGCTFFLYALFFMIDQTASAPFWVLAIMLPAGGLLNGLLLHYGYRVNAGGLKDSLFDAVHVQKGHMPFRTILIKPVAAIITLACGGSAGKEGPCSHIGASLGAAIGEVLRLNSELRQRLVACGISAGFASVFGTPVAGAIYGVEVLSIGRIRHDFLFPAIVAGVTSFQVSKWWGLPYLYYHLSYLPDFSEMLFFKIIVIGVIAGIVALIFVELVHGMGRFFTAVRVRFKLWPPLMPLIGGAIIALLALVIPTDYLGLSLPLVERAIGGEPMPYLGFFWKTLVVAITLGSGFYGGIATPQFVIGAMAGNAFAPLIGLDPGLGAAVGLVSVIAAASNTPIAAVLMGMELIGGGIRIVYLAGAAIAAYVIIGHRSIYLGQRMAYSKSSWMRIRPELEVGAEKVRLSHGLLRWWRKHGPLPHGAHHLGKGPGGFNRAGEYRAAAPLASDAAKTPAPYASKPSAPESSPDKGRDAGSPDRH
ncbi:chloride channel protein [Pikeienuella piscinae]|uniref:Chloride channel protein n=1 Tax=Pikeienuella piscinae TaxID=2748098 RepID=A0A7M3T7L5_9RHOB|nr:chloride channel protein [Pikeienuella piscinae]